MSDYLSALPVELIHKIFDSITTVDILLSIALVNKRLYSISRTYARYQLDLKDMGKKKKQFDLMCDQLPDLIFRIVSLTFNGKYRMMKGEKIDRIFKSITIDDTLPKLHSITLDRIDSYGWNSIRTRLQSLISLRSISIASVYDGKKSTLPLMSRICHDLLFTVRSLKNVSINTPFCHKDMITISSSPSMQLSTIECLSLTGVKIDLCNLFLVTPMLRQLDVELRKFFPPDILCCPPMYFRRLSINIFRATMIEIKHLLTPMVCLTDLTLNICMVDTDMTDGNAWISLLSRIVVFKFVFKVIGMEEINLDSYRTRFWLEEKKWYVTYDRWIGTVDSLLYTNPYCLDQWYRSSLKKETLVTESTGLEPTIFPHVESLWIDSQWAIEKVILNRFTHVRSLIIESSLNISLEYIATCLDVSRITNFGCGLSGPCTFSNEFVRILHTLPCLCSLSILVSAVVLIFDRQWPQIVHLNMINSYLHPCKPLSSFEIDSFWRSFTKLEQLAFCRETIKDLARFFDYRTTTLSNVVIRHYGNINSCNPPFITRKWLDENTHLDDFAYFCNNNKVVGIWF